MSKLLLFSGAALALTLSGVDAFTPAAATPALRSSGALTAACPVKGDAVALRMNMFGGMFGGGDDKDKKDKKKTPPKDDLEDAIEDWKDIGFDIGEAIEAEEKARNDKKK
mmetsp:Transcript_36415/g.71110  ORF Transcript_36415/g.71110 Transcript_36415/m.71110 type:complete len:110 (+) Transcript_36415:43-372(+)